MRTPDFRSPEWPAGPAAPATPIASPEASAVHRNPSAGQHPRGFAFIMHQKLAHAPPRPEARELARPTPALKVAAKMVAAATAQRAPRPQRDTDASRCAHPKSRANTNTHSAAAEPDSDVDASETPSTSSGQGASSAAPTNIVVLPLPGVIIPFPGPLPPSPPALEATGNQALTSADPADPLADVEIDVAWPGWRPARGGQEQSSIITPVDFRTNVAAASADAPTNLLPVDFGTAPGSPTSA